MSKKPPKGLASGRISVNASTVHTQCARCWRSRPVLKLRRFDSYDRTYYLCTNTKSCTAVAKLKHSVHKTCASCGVGTVSTTKPICPCCGRNDEER